jgi:hypothetical protein
MGVDVDYRNTTPAVVNCLVPDGATSSLDAKSLASAREAPDRLVMKPRTGWAKSVRERAIYWIGSAVQLSEGTWATPGYTV